MLKRDLNKKYKFIWLLNGEKIATKLPENVSCIKKEQGSLIEKFFCQWENLRAKYIVDSNKYVNKYHKNQVRFHLKHGLPMKDASDYTKMIGDLDVLCVPSDYWVDVCAAEHGIDTSKIKPFGFPRNDILVPSHHKHKTIMWMPTFRQRMQDNTINPEFDFNAVMPFGLPTILNIEQLQEINNFFKANDAYLLIRLHPAQNLSGINLADMSNIKICNDDFIKSYNTTLYKILTYTDALISDYSSVYYDYLLLDKPIALATADFEQYKKYNGILAKDYDEFQQNFPAVFIESYKDLLKFFEDIITDNPDAYRCSEAKEKYMSGCNNHSAEKIVDYMIANYNL